MNSITTFKTGYGTTPQSHSARKDATHLPKQVSRWVMLVAQLVKTLVMFARSWIDTASPPSRWSVSLRQQRVGRVYVLPPSARYGFGMRVDPPDRPPTRFSYQLPFQHYLSSFPMNEQPLLKNSIGLIRLLWQQCSQWLRFGHDAGSVRWAGGPCGFADGPPSNPSAQNQEQIGTPQRSFLGSLLMSFALILLSLGASAQSATTDLMVDAIISNANPAPNGVVTYTVTVTNSSTMTATNVKVKVTLPAGYVTPTAYVASTGAPSYTAASGDWAIASLSANSSATVQITATVIERGVAFLTAEVVAADQSDSDSVPNNGSYLEDDLDNVCFSVPLLLYAGEEYTVSAPAGFSGVQYFKGGNLVGSSSVPASEASIDANGNLVIKSTGTYSVAGSVSGCQATNCCNIQVDPGPLASLGDYVWLDNNRDGQQGTAALEPPVSGVTVQLFQPGSTTALSTTTTDGGGKYFFPNLIPGEYYVIFTAPNGFTYTNANVGSDVTDSDASPTTGQTQTYTLSGGESNTTVDAGLVPVAVPPASLGDKVFVDNNRNGIQDAGDAPVPGVVVTLYSNGTVVATTTTASSGTGIGCYSFTGLTPGNYQVVFTAPVGTTFTTPLAGTNTATDSNVNSTTGQLGGTGVISLSAGENNPTIDAGLIPLLASLGDYVWFDNNGDGQQGPMGSEPPVPGVVAQLYQVGTPTPINSATTNTSGFYSFTGLAPGQYYVVFTAPAGTTFTMANMGNDATDSDVASLTGQMGSTGIYSLSAGENNPTVDAGLIPLKASLGNYVWLDANSNGQQDPTETGVQNVTVTLFSNGSAVATQTTSTSGTYLFTNLDPGQYSVVFTAPNGLTFTTANTGSDVTDSDAGVGGATGIYSLSAGEQNLTVDAGLVPVAVPPASLGDKVFVDVNRNGIQDAGDAPVPGVVVTLYSNGTIVATTTTASSGTGIGCYSFTGLAPGNYQVVFTAPVGTTFTTPLAGTNTATDSNVNSTTGQLGGTSVVSLSAGENNPTIDAGLIPLLASLGDYVWFDNNGDGQQGPMGSEPPVPGVVAQLYQVGTASPINSATTNTSGFYSFTGLQPGQYYVVFTAPAGTTFTMANMGNDATDSDVASLTGQMGSTGIYSLSAGENNPTVDAGLIPLKASLGNYVWLDANSNGQQDPTETGVSNVTVTLFSNGSAIASQTTSASGTYLFTNLDPGQYSVIFTAPNGYTFTNANVGSDVTDSDAGVGGATGVYSLSAGEQNLTVDAGLVPKPASLGDKVFVDNNGNGIQDAGDTPVPGVGVTLYSNGTVVATTTTASSGTGIGCYSFTGLAPGNYYVVFTAPAGATFTTPLAGTNTANDSNVTSTTGSMGSTGIVSLTAGENNPTIDAGILPVIASLGDYVWFDNNGDGQQGSMGMEPPVPGVVAQLYMVGIPTPINSATTNTSGFYSFTGLAPGQYYVVFTAPVGTTFTTGLQGNPATDSNVNSLTGQMGATGIVSLSPGENNPTIDAGLIPLKASLGNYVWLDANSNGQQDPTETGVSNVTVTLFSNGSAVATQTTSASGTYLFTNLDPGQYSVVFTAPGGFTFTNANVGNDATDSDAGVGGATGVYSLSAGEQNLTVDAGLVPVAVPPASLGDKVFVDVNRNGIQDAGDTPLPGVIVTLISNGVVVGTTTTASSGTGIGCYSFTGLTPGVPYSVSFSTPAGYTATLPNVGNDSFDSDPIGGITSPITLTPGENNTTVDAGFQLIPIVVPPASLGDKVFVDNNRNGIQDAGDTPLPGVIVTLISNGVVVGTTTTASSGTGIGCYSFTGLTPGVPYSVSFSTPAGYTATLPNVGNDSFDSDPIGGITSPITLTAGENNTTVDAGFQLIPVPSCPNPAVIAVTSTTICEGGVVILTATTTDDSNIRWYLTPSGSNGLIGTVVSGQSLTVQPTTTTVYYAEVVGGIALAGCPRSPIAIEVTRKPPTPTCPERVTVCNGRTVDLTKYYLSATTGTNVFEWHTGLAATSPLVSNITAVGPGKYYLFERSLNGCYSNPSILTVDGESCECKNPATIVLGPGKSICEGESVVLTAMLGGGATSVNWTSTGSGTFATAGLSATYTPSAADIASELVTITGTTNDPDGAGVCTTASSNVVIDINERPDAPVGVACDDELVCQGMSTKLIGFSAQGARINWYGPNNTFLGSTASAGKLTVTPMATTVYYAEAVSADGCVSKTRSSVTVVVGQCKADLAITGTVTPGGPYGVGQTVTYVLTACNNGPATGENVVVNFPLPASVSYVSATPSVGTYNPATGSWSIGTMANGTCRNLFVEVVITGTGTISATAVITGTNNDPTKPANDTAVISFPVTQVVCNVTPPHITCAITDICKGDRTTLVADGCTGGRVVWSNGMSGMSISVSPQMTTVYTASCVVGNCTSAASNAITIRVSNPMAPIITASANSVCVGGMVSLTATGCEGGTILWSTGATGSVISTTIGGRTTITANCRINNCLSLPAEKVIDLGGDMPKPTVTCSTTVACPGEKVELTVNNCSGTPLWSTGETTTRIVVSPTEINNTFYVTCTNGNCRSPQSDNYTIRIVKPTVPVITASSATICANSSVTLTASGCADGTIQWSAGNATGNTLVVNPSTNISYFATCKVRDCISEPSVPAAIMVVNPTPPSVRRPSKPIVCSGESVTLTADGCAAGTIVWSNGMTGASIVIMPTETKSYSASCMIGSCRSGASNSELVTVNTSTGTAPTVTASKLVVCGGESISLTATGCTSGTVIWSDGQMGNVITVTPTASMNEFYAVCRTGTACGTPRSNTIKVRITPIPTPTVVCSESVICPGESVELTIQNCTGTPKWSTGETTATITVRPRVTTGYSVTCMSGACVSGSSNIYSITVIQPTPPTVVASATLVQPGESVTLTATCSVGTVQWMNGATTPSIVVSVTGTQSYQAFCKFRTCLSDGSATVTIITGGSCQAAAGSLRTESGTICAGSSNTVAISAIPNGGLVMPAGYSVLYVLTKGTDMVIQKTSATPTFTVDAENTTYRIHTLVYNATAATPNYLDLSVVQLGVTKASEVLALIAQRKICAALDGTGVPVMVKVVNPPTINGPSLTVCAGSSLTLTAKGCENGTITWSNKMTGQYIVISPVIEMVWVSATCTIDGCTSKPSASYDVDVIVPMPPTVTCNKPTICLGEQTTLEAVGCAGGRFQWESGETTSSITVTPTTTANTYRVRCVYGGCMSDYSPVCTVNVGGPNAPTVGIQTSGTTIVTSVTSCFGAPLTLIAKGCPAGAYNIWSNGDVGNRITVSPARNMTYTAQCCTSNNCKSANSNILTVYVGSKVAPPVTKDLTNTCPFTTVDLTKGVTSSVATTGGVFEYYSSHTPQDDKRVNNPGAVGRSGAYYAFEKTTAGCYSLGSVIHVRITACEGQPLPCDKNPLTADAGRDDKICAAKSYKLSGKATGGDANVQWTSNGTGKFDDPFLANATYMPSAEDLKAGKVTLTMAVRTPNTVCVAALDEMVLTIEGVKDVPVIRAIGSTNLCAGDSVVLEAASGDSYTWSNRAVGNRIVVKAGGTYSVQSFDKAGCSSLKSDEIVVTVGKALSAPLVSNKRNTCPATTVDLTTALNETATDGATYAFRVGTSPTSGLVMRPDAVTDGTYYAFRTNGAGCVSAPAAIQVKTFNCATDTVRADLAITKTASKTALNRGEIVTYTITVQNTGTKPASNVNIRDILPAGLELVPAQGNYNVSNGAITKWYGVLAANTAETITFQARATKKGAIVNTAEITYADQQDPNTANNKSSVTIADTSAARAGRIGLAKAVTSQKMLTDSTFEVEYAFRLTNYGDTDLTKVQVTDDLKAVFGTNTIQEVAVSTTDADNFKLTFNPAFLTGDSKMFDGNGTLKASATTYFFLSAKVKLDKSGTNRTFSNSAMAMAMSGETMTEDASMTGGDADPDGDGNPNNNTGATMFTLENKQTPVNPIGVALAVVSSLKQPDNSYNVTYKVTVKNFGEKELRNVSLSDSLVKAFPSPAAFTVVSGPTTRANSNLLANTGYNGNTNTNLLLPDSKLAAGEADTVLITVNIMPNGSNGPFYSSVLGTGLIVSTSMTVTDRSNNGVDPTPAGEQKTAVRFDLPAALLGVAKSVGTPVMVETGIFDVPYTIKVSNLGTSDLTKVQVVDNLSNTFNRGALILSNRIKATADAGLKADTLYTGQGLMTKMLVDSLSTLPKGTSRTLAFMVRVNVKNADSLTFYNSAVATAQAAGGVMVADTSTAGTNPDPKNNLDPRTSNDPTPVVLNSVPNKSYIGIALSVKDTVMRADGSYDVTFVAVVKNYGTVGMTNVTITDTLSKVFNELNGASFKIVGTPIASKGSGLVVNAGFNGASDVRLVTPEGSNIGAGRSDTLTFVVNVKSNGLTTTFLNTAYASGLANAVKVTDISTSGLNPDVNGNRNPTDAMEGEATQLILRVTDAAVFIPEGFSPNGDNINDLFVIKGSQNQTVTLEVFNRWGHMVYKSDDYKNDWNGTSNTGVRVNNTGGLPDGTYFYRVKLENGRTYVRYMTINR